MSQITPLVIFGLGAVVGSFLNVAGLRFVAKKSLGGRSQCPHCDRTLRWWELIPIISFIFVAGRCLRCQKLISVQYPIIELAAGLIALVQFTPLPSTLIAAVDATLVTVIAYILLILAIVDYRSLILPDRHILIVSVLVIILLVVRGSVPLTETILGALLGSGVLFALWIATRGQGIGFGDVKMMAPLGAVLGTTGVAMTLWAAFVTGGLVGIWLLWRRAVTLKSAIPFGPFLVGATIINLLIPTLARELLEWWVV